MPESIFTLAARALRKEVPERNAEIQLGLAQDGDAGLPAALDLTRAWVDERQHAAPAGTRIVRACLDGLDPLA